MDQNTCFIDVYLRYEWLERNFIIFRKIWKKCCGANIMGHCMVKLRALLQLVGTVTVRNAHTKNTSYTNVHKLWGRSPLQVLRSARANSQYWNGTYGTG